MRGRHFLRLRGMSLLALCLILTRLVVPNQGIAALQTPDALAGVIAFTDGQTVYEMDSNGANLQEIKPAESEALPGRLVWSPDGTLLAIPISYQDNRDSIVYVRDDISLESYSFTASGSFLDPSPSWSPDSKQIAFVSNRNLPRWQIYSTIIEGGRIQQLLSDGTGSDYSPAWSPDGKQIAFIRHHSNSPDQVYIMDADGSDPRFLVDTAGAAIYWSPNGKTIAYLTGDDYTAKICLINIDQTNQHCLTSLDESFSPAWSPDGKYIAFSGSSVSGAGWYYNDIYTVDADLSNLRRVTFNGDFYHSHFNPAWSPDSTKLAFVMTSDQGISIGTVNADGTDYRQLTETKAGDAAIYNVAWQPVSAVER